MSQSRLEQVLSIPLQTKKSDEEDLLAESLQRALDKTTPERAGCPWDGEHKPTQYSDDDLERDLIEKALPVGGYTGRSIIRTAGHYEDDS